MIFKQFLAVLEKFIFSPLKMPKHLKNFELDVDRMFLVILCMADMMCSARQTECAVWPT